MSKGNKPYTAEGFEKYRHYMGVTVLQTSSRDKGAEEIYTLYKKRWTIETFYNYFKNKFSDSVSSDFMMFRIASKSLSSNILISVLCVRLLVLSICSHSLYIQYTVIPLKTQFFSTPLSAYKLPARPKCGTVLSDASPAPSP